MNQNQLPRHRAGDPFDPPTELALLGADHDVAVRHGAGIGGQPHYVATAHATEATGDVLVVISPAAAGVLAQIVARFTATHRGPEVGLEDFDPTMWDHFVVDLLRNKALAGVRVTDATGVQLYGGPRPTPLEVVR